MPLPQHNHWYTKSTTATTQTMAADNAEASSREQTKIGTPQAKYSCNNWPQVFWKMVALGRRLARRSPDIDAALLPQPFTAAPLATTTAKQVFRHDFATFRATTFAL